MNALRARGVLGGRAEDSRGQGDGLVVFALRAIDSVLLASYRPQGLGDVEEWEGEMRGYFFRGVVLGSLTSAVVLGASAALAGTGVGGVFTIGKANTVNHASSLTGSNSRSQLTLSNTSTSAGTRGPSVSGGRS